jgi:hypothetical protein
MTTGAWQFLPVVGLDCESRHVGASMSVLPSDERRGKGIPSKVVYDPGTES